MPRGEPFTVRIALSVFLIFKLNESGARVAFDYDALASFIENKADSLARLVNRSFFHHADFLPQRIEVSTPPTPHSASLVKSSPKSSNGLLVAATPMSA